MVVLPSLLVVVTATVAPTRAELGTTVVLPALFVVVTVTSTTTGVADEVLVVVEVSCELEGDVVIVVAAAEEEDSVLVVVDTIVDVAVVLGDSEVEEDAEDDCELAELDDCAVDEDSGAEDVDDASDEEALVAVTTVVLVDVGGAEEVWEEDAEEAGAALVEDAPGELEVAALEVAVLITVDVLLATVEDWVVDVAGAEVPDEAGDDVLAEVTVEVCTVVLGTEVLEGACVCVVDGATEVLETTALEVVGAAAVLDGAGDSLVLLVDCLLTSSSLAAEASSCATAAC